MPKKPYPNIKSGLHLRNKHRKRYNFKILTGSFPELNQYVKVNEWGDESIDFFNPKAVKSLNSALLKQYYGINNWNIPSDYLIPPIPGRADYIHYIADLLGSSNKGKIPKGDHVKCLDTGVGANCIYPIIGHQEYGWHFIGSEIDPDAIKSALKIIESNPTLKGEIEVRLQDNPKHVFNGIIRNNEKFDLTICNPPFHASANEALTATQRKNSNLKQKKTTGVSRNFGGKNNELWCDGGEASFVNRMVVESSVFSNSCLWFTTLISKESNLSYVYKSLKKVDAVEVKTFSMGQGNKKSRIVAWTFLSKNKHKMWFNDGV